MSFFNTGDHYRSRLLDSLNWAEYDFMPAGVDPPKQCIYGHQNHSATVLMDYQSIPPKSQEGDAVISTGNHPVGVYTADCLPILFADCQHHHVAAAHGGLCGVVAGIHLNTMEKLCQLGATPGTLLMIIGPAIGPCCYELGQDMITRIQQQPLPAGIADTLPWLQQQPHNPSAVRPQAKARQNGVWFDLPQLARQMAECWGLPAQNIEQLNICTYCNEQTHGSYRRNTHFSQGYHSRFSWIRCRKTT